MLFQNSPGYNEMSKTNCNDKRGQSFKAIENFLRRVAHNLGNSPSQTEVKIVSCIPIDVTDLQQRIFQLQNELAELKSARKEPSAATDCPVCARGSPGPAHVCCNRCLLTATSVISVHCPGRHSFADLHSGSSACAPADTRATDTPDKDKPNTEKQSKSKHIFSKKKKESRNKNLKTQLVYHAYADTCTPFRNKDNLLQNLNVAREKDRDILDPSYLAGVVHRQYQHRPLLKESNLSDFSSPICRDDILFPYEHSRHSDTDVCSCCHGQFQNVDDFMNNRNETSVYTTSENTWNHQRTYYDSKYYDVVPVKDKVTKDKKNTERQKTKESKKPTIKCWPGKTRLKYRNIPTVVNYCAVPASQGEARRKCALRSQPAADRRPGDSTPRRPRREVDYSPVYPKPEKRQAKRSIIPIKILQHAATSSPATDNMANRQTATTITDDTVPGDKTETTLNQIKDILQSVLTEVKTSGKTVCPPPQPKKDAVVQNCPAPAARGYEYGASRLLQTYTYSPYNMHMTTCNMNRIPYKSSYLHPMSANNYMTGLYPECPGVPLQQYPLLVQPQKHLCSSYFGHNNRAMMKHAASAATNTEQAQEHSKETERLIKEIYKSIALNIEESSKDNSVVEYMKTKSITDKYINLTKTESDTESERVAKAISEIFKNTNLQDSTATGTTDSIRNSYVDERKTQRASREPATRAYIAERAYSQKQASKYDDEKKERKVHRQSKEESSDITIINEESEESSSESDTDEELEVKKEPTKTAAIEAVKIKESPKVVDPKKEKSGLFKKVMKIFQSRPRRRRGRRDSVGGESEPASESDSDDYQTVYSSKVAGTPTKQVAIARSKPRSSVFYVNQSQQHSRPRSPIKQTRIEAPHAARTEPDERYRPSRDEKRPHDYHHHSSRYAAGRDTGDRGRGHTHAYYQKYETRPILVQQNNRSRAPGPRYPTTRSQHLRARESCDERQARTHASPARQVQPHFVASKRGLFSKGWMAKTKVHCGRCSQDWKDLIING